MTLGSLFDGSGGFPLAGVINGITPVWASEIEPYPLRVTAARFPDMKQLGDVTKIDGTEIEPVDIITFGSPCQDLSVAGLQKGIHDGERSNLFFEAIRIIKEMRDKDAAVGRTDEHIRPRFAVWENVPGAFSSNKGEDFRSVLEAFASVREDGLSIPRPKKWNHAGCVVGDGWSVAWRVYDAQYWGVPQRRKRIYLIADFASERAGEILFERESVCGHPAEGGAAREGTAADAEGGVGGSTIAFKERAGKPGGGKGILPCEGRAFTLATNTDQNVCYSIEGHIIDRKSTQNGRGWGDGYAHTLNATDRHGVCYAAAFMGGQGARARSIAYHDDGTAPTLKASPSGGNTVPDVCYPATGLTNRGYVSGQVSETVRAECHGALPSVCYPINTMVATRGGKDDMRTTFGIGEPGDPQFTLQAAHEHAVCYALDSTSSNSMKSKNPHSGFHAEEIARTIDTHQDPTCNQGGNVIVERPCYALQGNGIDRADTAGCNGKGWRENEMYTLNTIDRPAVAYAPTANHCGSFAEADIAATLETGYHYGSGGDAALVCYDCRGNGDGKTAPTLTGDHQNRVTDYTAVACYRKAFKSPKNGKGDRWVEDQTTNTLNCFDTGDVRTAEAIVYPKVTGALCANSHPGSYTGQDAFNDMLPVHPANTPPRKYIVRRLTPLECCRLQGFPDWWEDGVEGSDSARYKMWGNGIALPCAVDVLGRIAVELRRTDDAET